MEKGLIASERDKAEVRQARSLWVKRRLLFMQALVDRLVFLDETSTNTKLTRMLHGARLFEEAPFSRRSNQTLIAGVAWHLRQLPRARMQRVLTDAERLRCLRYRSTTLGDLSRSITFELIAEIGLPQHLEISAAVLPRRLFYPVGKRTGTPSERSLEIFRTRDDAPAPGSSRE